MIVAALAAAAACSLLAPPAAAPAGATAPLVRPGARSALLCRYRGLNPAATAHRLLVTRLVRSRSAVASLARALDALRPVRGVFSCPFDDGSEVVATFAYPRGARVVVRVGLSGCRLATGTHPPVRAATPDLLARLSALLG